MATLRDYTDQKGYNTSYDPKTKAVTVTNPTTGKTITFDNGQGSEYGMGGSSGGYNLLSDPSKLDAALAGPSYQRSPLMGLSDLASMYGITYDENAILDKFNNATRAEYDAKRKEHDITSNKFYQDMYGTEETALDTIRKSNAAAVATGASRGVQAANELSAILGLEDTNTQTASQLAQQRNLLTDQEAAAMTKNVLDAMTTSNQIKQALAGLAANVYASDTQFDVGELQYNAALNQAQKALEGTKYTADSNLEGSKYASDKNLEGNEYTANQNLAGTKYASDANKAAAQITAKGNVDAANAAGAWNYKAAQASNAAQKAYYDYMQKNGTGNATTDYQAAMEFLNGKYQKYMSSKDYENAAIWFSQLTGMPYNDALKKVKSNSSDIQAEIKRKAMQDAKLSPDVNAFNYRVSTYPQWFQNILEAMGGNAGLTLQP